MIMVDNLKVIKSKFWIRVSPNIYDFENRFIGDTEFEGYVFRDRGLNFGVFRDKEERFTSEKLWHLIELKSGKSVCKFGFETRKTAIEKRFFDIERVAHQMRVVGGKKDMTLDNYIEVLKDRVNNDDYCKNDEIIKKLGE